MGAPRGVGAVWVSGGVRECRGVRGVLGASRNSRYSGTRRGIGHQEALGPPKGSRGPFEGIKGVSESVGVSEVYWGLAGTLGAQGPEGV